MMYKINFNLAVCSCGVCAAGAGLYINLLDLEDILTTEKYVLNDLTTFKNTFSFKKRKNHNKTKEAKFNSWPPFFKLPAMLGIC